MNVTSAKVAVAFGGPSPEHDVSILTGLQAARARCRARNATSWACTGPRRGTGIASTLRSRPPTSSTGSHAARQVLQLVTGGEGAGFVAGAGRLGRTRPLPVDAVVNCCHGGPGEDGTLQGALDLVGVPYTGPGMAAAALGMDKLAFAGLVQAAGLPTLPRALLDPGLHGRLGGGSPTRTDAIGFPAPYILKPRFGGSSIGVEVVADLDTALARLDVNHICVPAPSSSRTGRICST